MINYIITNNLNNTLKDLLPRFTSEKITYINSTSPGLLLTIPDINHHSINYEIVNSLQQVIDKINDDNIYIIENLSKFNLEEYLLVQLFKKLSNRKKSFIVDNRKLTFIELMCDDIIVM
ncbi:hypothetical protein SBY92_005465 [Candida maltosa Xu316]